MCMALPSALAARSLLVAMLSFQAGSSLAKRIIPLVGAPGTTALRLGLSALIVCVVHAGRESGAGPGGERRETAAATPPG